MLFNTLVPRWEDEYPILNGLIIFIRNVNSFKAKRGTTLVNMNIN